MRSMSQSLHRRMLFGGLILFALLITAHTGFSQVKKDVGFIDEPAEKVFNALSKTFQVRFFYSGNTTARAQRISMPQRQRTLDEALGYLQSNYRFVFKRDGNMIAIVRDSVAINNEADKTVNANFSQKTPVQLVSGKVLDENDHPLSHATVSVSYKGTIRGTETNIAGEFKIMGNIEDVLLISYVGYAPQNATIKDYQQYINVKLVPVERNDQEVIVTGMFKKSDKTYTGAAVTYTAKELKEFGNRNLVSTLANIEPAFKILQNNQTGSDPNKLPDIQIRGNSSIPNVSDVGKDGSVAGMNVPLIVIDGFESSLDKMVIMNDNDVESITILKDASATAIYGSRGANGVVVITTRAPKPGKLRVSYSGGVNIEAPDLSSYNLLDARRKLDLEYKMGLYSNADPGIDLALKRYYNYLLGEVNKGVNTDWLAQPVRQGTGQRHGLRFEGGDQTFRYSLAVQMNDIEGAMKGSANKIYNGTINLSYNYKRLRISNNFMLTDAVATNSPYGGFNEYALANPYWEPRYSNGQVIKLLGDPGNNDYLNRWGTLPTNPMYNATLGGFDKAKNNSFTNNTSIEWSIIRNLTARVRFGITKGINQSDIFRTADNTAFATYAAADIFRKGDYAYNVGNTLSYDGAFNLSYSKVFSSKHLVFLGVDASTRQSTSSSYGFRAEGFPNAKLDVMSMGLQYAQNGKPSGDESISRLVGFTGNANYSYNGRYFVDGSLRYDGSSQFGSDKRFAPFWSAGMGWNIQNEQFMKHQKVVDRLKLRASVGSAGAQSFSSSQALSTYQYYTSDRYYNAYGVVLKDLGNPALAWQKTMKYNAGADAEFLHNRVKVTADYYVQRTNGLVSSVNLPASNGFPFYIANIGTIENKGYELRVTGILLRNNEKGINWSVTAALTRNDNKLVKLSQSIKDAQQKYDDTSKARVPNSTSFHEGYSTNTIWAVRSLGIDPSTGKEVFLTADGKPTFTWSSSDLAAVGLALPKLQGMFSSLFRYKRFSANIAFAYRLGGQVYNQTLVDRVEVADFRYNVDARVYTDRWQKPGDMTAFKGLQVTTSTNKTSRFVQNESTLDCSNINMQYEMRGSFVNKVLHLESLSFAGNMSDVFYISTIKRERGTSYPYSKQISFSINATF